MAMFLFIRIAVIANNCIAGIFIIHSTHIEQLAHRLILANIAATFYSIINYAKFKASSTAIPTEIKIFPTIENSMYGNNLQIAMGTFR